MYPIDFQPQPTGFIPWMSNRRISGGLPSVLVTRGRWKTLPKVRPRVSLIYPVYKLAEMISTHCIADIISTVEFDHTGDYLATGDKGGRVVLFERNEQVSISFSLSICSQLRLCRNGGANTSSTRK